MKTVTEKIEVYFTETSGGDITDVIDVEVPANATQIERREIIDKKFLKWLERAVYSCGWSTKED